MKVGGYYTSCLLEEDCKFLENGSKSDQDYDIANREVKELYFCILWMLNHRSMDVISLFAIGIDMRIRLMTDC